MTRGARRRRERRLEGSDLVINCARSSHTLFVQRWPGAAEHRPDPLRSWLGAAAEDAISIEDPR